MEVMEEGILMDRLPILLQRDMQYYEVNRQDLIFSRSTFVTQPGVLAFLEKQGSAAGNYLSRSGWGETRLPAICFICVGENRFMVKTPHLMLDLLP